MIPSSSKEMDSAKLLGLVNTQAVICQPWGDLPMLAKKTIFSWENNTLKRLKTVISVRPKSQKFSSCACLPSVANGASHQKQDFHALGNGASHQNQSLLPTLALCCTPGSRPSGSSSLEPKQISANNIKVGLSNKNSRWTPWSNKTYAEICIANELSSSCLPANDVPARKLK